MGKIAVGCPPVKWISKECVQSSTSTKQNWAYKKRANPPSNLQGADIEESDNNRNSNNSKACKKANQESANNKRL